MGHAIFNYVHASFRHRAITAAIPRGAGKKNELCSPARGLVRDAKINRTLYSIFGEEHTKVRVNSRYLELASGETFRFQFRVRREFFSGIANHRCDVAIAFRAIEMKVSSNDAPEKSLFGSNRKSVWVN